jgi:hypothetical protein
MGVDATGGGGGCDGVCGAGRVMLALVLQQHPLFCFLQQAPRACAAAGLLQRSLLRNMSSRGPTGGLYFRGALPNRLAAG